MLLANSLMKLGLFSLGSLSLVILIDSPVFALKLTTLDAFVTYKNGTADPDDFFWDKAKYSKSEAEGGYPNLIPFKWFILAKNENKSKVILKKVSFQLQSNGGPNGAMVDVGPLIHLTPPSFKVSVNEQVGNIPESGSTTQYFHKAAIFPSDPDTSRFLQLDLSNAHVTVVKHVPGPLPLLGAAAAFSYSRKLRRSLKAKGGDASCQKQ